jgi:hypothetical protein
MKPNRALAALVQALADCQQEILQVRADKVLVRVVGPGGSRRR